MLDIFRILALIFIAAVPIFILGNCLFYIFTSSRTFHKK